MGPPAIVTPTAHALHLIAEMRQAAVKVAAPCALIGLTLDIAAARQVLGRRVRIGEVTVDDARTGCFAKDMQLAVARASAIATVEVSCSNSRISFCLPIPAAMHSQIVGPLRRVPSTSKATSLILEADGDDRSCFIVRFAPPGAIHPEPEH
jgi:hypothetical protein